MEKFHHELLREARPIWDAFLSHRFLAETAAGRIAPAVFSTWMRQDYLFVREAIPFLAILAARAPGESAGPLYDAVAGLRDELRLFERMAETQGVSLAEAEMSPTCHAYSQFLLASAYGKSFEEAFTVLYGAEKSYFDSWRWVKDHQTGESPYQAFIDHWTSPSFESWVDWIASELDRRAADAPAPLREKMKEVFLLTGRYEYLFWEMAATSESWPL